MSGYQSRLVSRTNVGFIATMYQIRPALLAGALTVISVIASLALDQTTGRSLLVLIPILASAVIVLQSEQGCRIRLTAAYIHKD
jgi:hypothetical protein